MRAVRLWGGVAAASGFVALLGWATGRPVLASLGAHHIPMAPSTALLFVLYGIAVFLVAPQAVRPGRRLAAVALSVAGALAAGALLVLGFLGVHPAFERLGFQAVGSVGAAPIGHMSPVTAACFLLASASLTGALAPAARGDWPSRWASSSAWILLAASSVLLLAYLFGSPLFYGGSFIPPAATTSAGFAALAAALIGLSLRRAEARGKAGLVGGLPRSLVIVFLLFAAAIFSVGGLYYRGDAERYRAELEERLLAVADLKAVELAQWRAERAGDASLFLGNPPFAALVRRLFAEARDGDSEVETQLRSWLSKAQTHYPYERVSLLDPRGSEKLAVPGGTGPAPAAVRARIADAIRSASVVFVDFYRDERDGRVRLGVLAPILDERGGPLAVIAFRIDPETTLYPLVARRPTLSRTAETALVRREGNDAVVLSELRPGDGTALTARTPVSSRNAAVVKAALGQEGIVEAEDRGTSVIAALRAIPGSGWFLIAHLDAAEANAPLRDRLRLMVVLLGGLLAATAAGVAAVWREQRVRDLRQQREAERGAEEQIRRLNRVYAVLSEVNQAIVRVRDLAALFAEACRIAVETGGFRMAWVGMLEPEGRMRPVAHAGVVDGYLERLRAAGRGELDTHLEALRQGRHDLCNDLEIDPRTAPWRPEALALGYRASVAFPLTVNGDTVAAFTLYASEPQFFDENELRLLDEMAMDLSFAMETARLEDLSLRLATAVDQAPVSVMVTGIDGLIEYVNPAFTRITGYGPDEAVGKNPRMLKSGQQDGALYQELWATIRAGGSWHGQLVNRRKDGSFYTQELTIAPIRDRAGHVLRFVGIGQDVTERRRAEQALLLARSALDQAADMILWVDRDGRLIYANETAATQLGYARDELLGSEIWRIAIGPSPETWPGMWEAARQAGSVRTEGVSLRKDGSSFPSEVVVTHVAFGETELQCAVVRDIAERSRAEAAILEEKEFSEALLDSLPGLFALFDEAGRLLRWNRTFEAVSGYSAAEVAAMTPLDFFGGTDRAKVEDGFRQVFETGSASAELALVTRGGQQIPHYFVGVRVALRGVPCCIATAIDVTARKALEEQLRQSQKIEAIGQLAGGVAHDFNNILGVISGYGELAQRQLPPAHPARPRLDQIMKAAGRAADLTRQLLAFSRRQVMQPRALDLNALLAGEQAMLGRLLGEQLELVVRLGAELGTVMADPGQIEQVVLNLALNARDAMPKGGSLTLETSNVEFDEAYAAAHAPSVRGNYVMLAVSDTGVGMDPATQQRIFEPFFTTKPEGQGTGLGLATVYGIVKQSGGFIWVYSEPGRGTTFKLYLPRVDQAAQPAPAAGPPAEAPRGAETILLVEDTETLREVIREILEERGYTLLLALDGEEALARARAHEGQIDLLLTDVVMPKLGGRDLARQLSLSRPALKVLYMSGYTEGAISQHGILGEGLALLEKPFSADRLARAVREALDRE